MNIGETRCHCKTQSRLYSFSCSWLLCLCFLLLAFAPVPLGLFACAFSPSRVYVCAFRPLFLASAPLLLVLCASAAWPLRLLFSLSAYFCLWRHLLAYYFLACFSAAPASASRCFLCVSSSLSFMLLLCDRLPKLLKWKRRCKL